MNKNRKICVVSTTRADYSILYPVLNAINNDEGFLLQVVVSGTHLSPEFGLTYTIIEKDGFEIAAKVEALLSSDTAVGVTKSMGIATIGFAEAFDRLKPDLVVVLGDRYEILAAAQAALIARIPIAHIAGGDITQGAFDDSIRHAITKMAHIHFPTTPPSAQRIQQLGEDPKYVFAIGNPAIDTIRAQKLLTRAELSDALHFTLKKRNFAVTFHPATLDPQDPAIQFANILEALSSFDDTGIIFTKPNADPRGRAIGALIDEYVARNQNAKAYDSLGATLYYSLLANVDVVIGNSSSGIYEAPFFKIPTVNIGDRQKGRFAPPSVIHCAPHAKDVVAAVDQALLMDRDTITNPFGDGTSTQKIISILKSISDFRPLLNKSFIDIPGSFLGAHSLECR